MPWLRRIFRLDAMRHVGARYAIGDLPPDDWTALITANRERGQMERRVSDAKDKVARQKAPGQEITQDGPAKDALNKARKLSGAPPPGGSLFGAAPRRRRK